MATENVWQKGRCMSKPFSKRQLVDQLGFSADEAYIILEYQKKLPILIENEEIGGFCVDARDLWLQLGSYTTNYSLWFHKRIKSYKLAENVDFKPKMTNVIKPNGGRPPEDYVVTLDIAKMLAMVEKSDIGNLTRRYFILMEKAVKKMAEWSLIRTPLRKQYINLKKAMDSYLQRVAQISADEWDYKLEADALNTIATGFKAQAIRNFVGCQDNVTRDSLTAVYNGYLLFLEELDIILLGMNMGRYDRYKMLKDAFDVKYPNAIPIKSDVSMQIIKKNKERLLQMEKEKELMPRYERDSETGEIKQIASPEPAQ